jgi:DNA-binding NarL/FixJ family response regulator
MSSSLRSFLRTIPEVQVVAQAVTPQEITQAVTICRPNLLLLDADMPDLDLTAFLEKNHTDCPTIRVIVLASSQKQQRTAEHAGANSALLKGSLDDELRRAILTPVVP